MEFERYRWQDRVLRPNGWLLDVGLIVFVLALLAAATRIEPLPIGVVPRPTPTYAAPVPHGPDRTVTDRTHAGAVGSASCEGPWGQAARRTQV